MSYQETKLQAIADAIREKDGTTEPIPANDFPARIRAIPTGSLPEDIRTISLVSANSALGEVTGSGKASDGMIVTAKSLAAPGYKIQNWTENGEIVSQEAEYRFTVEKDRSLVANFKKIQLVGTEWVESTMVSDTDYISVAYGNGIFVACSITSDFFYYSFDGINWSESEENPLPSGFWYNVGYGNGKFVAVPADSNIASYSSDGIHWTQTTLPYSGRWRSVVWGNGKFVAVGQLGYSAYSLDGISWISAKMPGSSWYSITYGNGKFVAISRLSTVAAYSEDGISWTETSVPTSENRQSVAYGNGKYIAVSYDNRNKAIISTDGITWTQTSLPTTARWRYVTYGAGKFVIVTHTNNIVAYSEDGEVWETTTLPVVKAWQSVTFGNETFVAVGTGIECAYSK